jgi:hypothetical protein
MKKLILAITTLFFVVTAGFAEGESGSGSIMLGNIDFFSVGDKLTVLPGAQLGGSFDFYVPYTDEWSSFGEGSGFAEYDILSNEFGFLYGTSFDVSYRHDLLTLRTEISSKGNYSIGVNDRFVEVIPKLQATVGNLDFSFVTHHSLVAVYKTALDIGYRGDIGAAFPLFDTIVTETDLEGFVSAALASFAPIVRFSAYPNAALAITGLAGVRKSFAFEPAAAGLYDYLELLYNAELSTYFLTRSEIKLGIEGYTRFFSGSSVSVETRLMPRARMEIEFSDILSVLITIDTSVYMPALGTVVSDGNVSVLLKFSF